MLREIQQSAGEHTDLLILLYHYVSSEANDNFKPEQRGNRKTAVKVRNIKVTKLKLGNGPCKDLFFEYAVLGCDTCILSVKRAGT